MLSRRLGNALLALLILALAADVAQAAILPAPFEFTFFSSALNALFLLPFQLAGCG